MSDSSHFEIKVDNGYCRTFGLQERFGAHDLSMKLEPLHLVPAAIHLLNEAGNRQVQGQCYSEKSLFRYRSGAHLCQFLFQPGPWDTLEMVDLVLCDNSVRSGHNAMAALTYFTQGCPHWNLGFGWPPRPLPIGGLPRIVPGTTSKQEIEKQLGLPHRGRNRWLFAHSGTPIRLDVQWSENGVTTSVSSNNLVAHEWELSESTTLDGMETLRKADLQRTFVAPPDQTLVRIEEVRVYSHPILSGSSLLVLSEYDSSEVHRLSTCSWIPGGPRKVVAELRPSFGKKLMTGFSPASKPSETLAERALELRTYMEASVRLVRQMATAFGKSEWATEALDGFSLIVGAYLMVGSVPEKEVLQQLGLPTSLYLEAFGQLESYVQRPETRVKFHAQAEQAGVEFEQLAAFQWLLYSLTSADLDSVDQRLAVDLAQVFQQFRNSLRGLA